LCWCDHDEVVRCWACAVFPRFNSFLRKALNWTVWIELRVASNTTKIANCCILVDFFVSSKRLRSMLYRVLGRRLHSLRVVVESFSSIIMRSPQFLMFAKCRIAYRCSGRFMFSLAFNRVKFGIAAVNKLWISVAKDRIFSSCLSVLASYLWIGRCVGVRNLASKVLKQASRVALF
jgi:hypothetical protein